MDGPTGDHSKNAAAGDGAGTYNPDVGPVDYIVSNTSGGVKGAVSSTSTEDRKNFY